MRAARWTLRVVMLAGLGTWLVLAVPGDLRIGIREALRPPAVTQIRVDHVEVAPVHTAQPGRDHEWIITAGDKCLCTNDDAVAQQLHPGRTYVVAYHGNFASEQCLLLSVVDER